MAAAKKQTSAKKPAAKKSTAKKPAAKKPAAKKPATRKVSSVSKAKASAAKKVAAGGERIGRGTRWTEQQVKLLMDTVASSATAQEGFEAVAKQIGKSKGTVQQKYYNLQRAAGGTRRGPGRPRGGAAAAALPSSAQLRKLEIDQLVGLARLVKTEVDRRRSELDDAAGALADLAG